MSAVMRDKQKDQLRHKIKKSDRHFLTEKQDNYREHLFDKNSQTWKFDYSEKALDKKEQTGPFVMSRLAASTMCDTGDSCRLHNPDQLNIPLNVPHVGETDSVKATIAPEVDEKRAHDFDGINLDVNKKEEIEEDRKKDIAIYRGLPIVLSRRTETPGEEKVEDPSIFKPRIISSSFVRKIPRKRYNYHI